MTYLKPSRALPTLFGRAKDREPAPESKLLVLGGQDRHGPATIG